MRDCMINDLDFFHTYVVIVPFSTLISTTWSLNDKVPLTCGEPVTYSGKQQIGHKEQTGESLLPENISLPFVQ